MLREQGWVSWVPSWNGAFDLTGRITPSSTRLEGLQALSEISPLSHPDRPRIDRAVEIGLRFVLRAQVEAGEARGGFTGAWPALLWTDDAAAIRIDYVRHALSALVTRRLCRSLTSVNAALSSERRDMAEKAVEVAHECLARQRSSC